MKKLAIASALLVSLASGGTALADTCKKVDLKVTNKKSNKIKVTKFSFKCADDNEDRSESVANRELKNGESTTYEDQNLAGCEGRDMKYLTVHFNANCGGKWSATDYTVKKSDFTVAKCSSNSDKQYAIDVPVEAGCSNP
jgi:hypothetical protein